MMNKTNHFPLSTGILRSSHNSKPVRMAAMSIKSKFAAYIIAMLVMLLPICAGAQVPVALAPVVHMQFLDNSGKPLANGCVSTFQAGTTTNQATYVDSTGTSQNTNPIILNAGGFADIWLAAQAYKIKVVSAGGVNCVSGVTQYTIDNVVEQGLLTLAKAVLLAPTGGALQTVTGPIAATYFQQTQSPFTSPGVRVGILDPSTILQTATNPPTMVTVNPAAPGQTYNIPDPLTPISHFVMDTGAGNTLDCTAGTVTCKRTASFYFGGASCNGSTASLGYDAFATNAPLAFCITGTNTQKGVMGLPAAYTHLQQNSGTNSATTTVTTTYPNATTTGSMLVLSVAFNGTTTVTGCTDTTNAYVQAKHVATGALSLDIWVFHNAATKVAGTTLTCTFAGAASSSLKWHEYLVPNTTSTDVSASNTGTSSSATTGTTGGTSQATELVFAAAGDLAVPTLVPATAGYADHTVVNNAAVVQVDDAGLIQQAATTQTATFTLGSAQTWASAIVTFKATNGATATAQKTILLPAFFNSAQTINALIEWSNPLVAIGTSNVVLGASLVCSANGATDDPAFNTTTTANSPAGQTSMNTLSQASLTALSSTGCVAGNVMHYQISRLRYNASDIYEGFANVYGSVLSIGVSQ